MARVGSPQRTRGQHTVWGKVHDHFLGPYVSGRQYLTLSVRYSFTYDTVSRYPWYFFYFDPFSYLSLSSSSLCTIYPTSPFRRYTFTIHSSPDSVHFLSVRLRSVLLVVDVPTLDLQKGEQLVSNSKTMDGPLRIHDDTYLANIVIQ